MTIDTKKVEGRRELHFETLDEILADAEMLVAAEDVQTLGNWTLGQILYHLAVGQNMSLDGDDYRPPWLIRVVAPYMKKGILNGKMSPGFQLPRVLHKKLIAQPTLTPAEGLEALRKSTERVKSETPQPRNPVFGKMTPAEWVQLHLRHAELHLSFAVPKS